MRMSEAFSYNRPPGLGITNILTLIFSITVDDIYAPFSIELTKFTLAKLGTPQQRHHLLFFCVAASVPPHPALDIHKKGMANEFVCDPQVVTELVRVASIKHGGIVARFADRLLQSWLSCGAL